MNSIPAPTCLGWILQFISLTYHLVINACVVFFIFFCSIEMTGERVFTVIYYQLALVVMYLCLKDFLIGAIHFFWFVVFSTFITYLLEYAIKSNSQIEAQLS